MRASTRITLSQSPSPTSLIHSFPRHEPKDQCLFGPGNIQFTNDERLYNTSSLGNISAGPISSDSATYKAQISTFTVHLRHSSTTSCTIPTVTLKDQSMATLPHRIQDYGPSLWNHATSNIFHIAWQFHLARSGKGVRPLSQQRNLTIIQSVILAKLLTSSLHLQPDVSQFSKCFSASRPPHVLQLFWCVHPNLWMFSYVTAALMTDDQAEAACFGVYFQPPCLSTLSAWGTLPQMRLKIAGSNHITICDSTIDQESVLLWPLYACASQPASPTWLLKSVYFKAFHVPVPLPFPNGPFLAESLRRRMVHTQAPHFFDVGEDVKRRTCLVLLTCLRHSSPGFHSLRGQAATDSCHHSLAKSHSTLMNIFMLFFIFCRLTTFSFFTTPTCLF